MNCLEIKTLTYDYAISGHRKDYSALVYYVDNRNIIRDRRFKFAVDRLKNTKKDI
ncbi:MULTISPECIES: hypothetical protein [unclassified Campylobacter]|uniref:hypothetical protein n=1 Tax=unclassified Campylobacter TaxID=2593542 RepID=UPI001BD9C6D8|nr:MULTISPECIES: hypothetical protein [unclassified Campylobacter]MBZ7982143.1 hypothetical protein [Campylobacter sp. RM12640]MBZ7983627.1 hypothetical protein [Campylobacter sp. RM12647]MBZ7989766.1 hypothetical protein [Campylobacter sp. RM12635]MBZ7991777.1 hypothetical protein [Campylobacter sp. RM9331]MBZ8005169.1 hypothetical protein [Campylobacter sp. RM9332]